jgi:glucose-6-phosphate 1-dehydrogenase
LALDATPFSDDDFRKHLLEGIQEFSRRKEGQDGSWEKFSACISYLQMDAEDEAAYKKYFGSRSAVRTKYRQRPNVIFYLAVAPQLVPDIAKKLSAVQYAATSNQHES